MRSSISLRGGLSAALRPARDAGVRRRASPGRLRSALLIATALATLSVLALLWQQGLLPPWGEMQGQVDARCRLDQQPAGCQARFADGAVMQLRLAPQPSTAGDPLLALSLHLSHAAARGVDIDLNGATMNMGPNVTRLVRQADGSWAGSTTLSVCITGRMDWLLTVRARVGGGERVARFRFSSGG